MKLADHLDKIEAFKTVAESRTMSEAAKRLHITQPSLTRLIQTLESAAGVQLLTRGRHGVSVTDAGRRLLGYTTLTLNGLTDLEQQLRFPKHEISGHLRIGAYASLGEYLWPEFLPDFRKKYPHLRISIFSAERISHSQSLALGEIDILIDAEPRLSGGAISWNLYEDRFNFYCRKSLSDDLTPVMITDTTLIFNPNAFDNENKKILQHLEERGYFFKERLEFDSFMAVLAFARKGVGLAILPNRLAHADVEGGRLKRSLLKGFPLNGFGQHQFAATVMESKKDDQRIKTLIQALRSWLRQ